MVETYVMFFSHDFDITHTSQRLAKRGWNPHAHAVHAQKSEQAAKAADEHNTAPSAGTGTAPPTGAPRAVKIEYADREQRFVWNRQLLSSLVPLDKAWESLCLLPVMTGFVSILPLAVGAGATPLVQACMALIARRDWHRCGYRCAAVVASLGIRSWSLGSGVEV